MPRQAICVSCVTGAEQAVSEKIRTHLQVTTYYPTWVRELRVKGRFVQQVLPLLPGYLFVYLDDESCVHQIAGMEKVNRVLKYGDGSHLLFGGDLAFADWVYEQSGQVGLSRVMLVGDEMVIIDGPMKDYEGRIKRVDKHNRYAEIEIDLDGKVKRVKLGFQWMAFKDGQMVRWQKSEALPCDRAVQRDDAASEGADKIEKSAVK